MNRVESNIYKRNFLKQNLYFLFAFFVVLSPFVNNLNGLTMRFYGISLVGPLFYGGFLLLFGIFGLMLIPPFEQPRFFLICFGTVAWYLLQFFCRLVDISSIQYYIKFFFPFIIYACLKYSRLSDKNLTKIEKLWRASILVYSFFILLSFLIGFKYYGGKGYYGFIHGINDLTFLLLLGFYSIMTRSSLKGKIVYVVSVLLTFSKMIFLFVPLLVFYGLKYVKGGRRREKAFFWRSASMLVLLVAAVFASRYFISYFTDLVVAHKLNSVERVISTHKENPDFVYRFITFGRYRYLKMMIDRIQEKSYLEIFFGSGIIGATRITSGKVGIEMDPPDAFNIFGILGFLIVIYFYYVKPMASKYAPGEFKFYYIMCIIYSVLGGHLIMNPISNTFYVIYLVILERGLAGRKRINT